ncbi:MAG: FAD-dependent oxidoreductase, partial [Sphingomonas sp.]
TQGFQEAIQNRVIAPLLARSKPLKNPPIAALLLDEVPLLRRLPARILGLGFRSEHVRSPDAGQGRSN